ncbi:phosphatidylserine decarboxylase-domain-containing protein [Mycena maculata]|uniref:Phosphatidylserine decarboxylase proenzyme 2 n=1 Tax=Mycena maculata TaxID=230809 RepID=A0AAD7MXV0_9AGAR|nr:phosphatidylserine decarboxylase-domain-containing protein [Mycena maculata]
MTAKKHPRLRRALKLPFHARNGTNSVGRNTFAPRPGEQPIVFLRVQVLGCNDILAKDRNGFSDPFVVASLLRARHHTPVAKKTVNPVYAPKDATWDFPVYLSIADKLGVVELVVWDKDVIRKDYLGEVGIPVDEWFGDGDGERAKGWDAPGNVPFRVPLVSSKPGTAAQGTIQLRLGFVAPPPPTARAPNQAAVDFDAVYRNLIKTGRNSLVSAPPSGLGQTIVPPPFLPFTPPIPSLALTNIDGPQTEGVGTLRSHLSDPDFQDDGGLSSASSDSDSEDGNDSEENGDSEDECDECDEEDEESPDALPPISPSVSRLQALYAPPEISVIPGSPASELGAAGVKTPTVSTPTPTGPSPLTTPTPSSTGTVPAPPTAATPTPAAAGAMPVSTSTSTSTSEEKTGTKKGRPGFIPLPLPLPRKFLARSRPGTPGEVGGGKDKDKDKDKEKEGRKRFRRSWSGAGSPSMSMGMASLEDGGKDAPGGGKDRTPSSGKGKGKEPAVKEKEKEGKGKGRRRSKPQRAFSLGPEGGGGERDNDIVGIVMLEIEGAVDLPRLKNMTRTSFDMDPFVVISFGKKVFRTRVIRHSLNPVWDEKLLFHVRRYEIGYEVRLTVLDWDKLTSNDYIGEAAFNVGALVADAPQPLPPPDGDGVSASAATASPSIPASGDASARGTRIPLYAEAEGGDHPMTEFKLKLEIGPGGGGKEPVLWESKHRPVLSFRAKYQPYALLRQRFWRQYLKQYDTDDTATLSRVEITTMLDSLGSTLTAGTVDSFFTRFGKDPRRDDLSVEEAIRCLETELLRPESERRRVDDEGGGAAAAGAGTSLSASPSPAPETGPPHELRLAEIDFAGPSLDVDFLTGEPRGYVTEPADMVLLAPGVQLPTSESSSDADADAEGEESGSASASAFASTPASSSSTPSTPPLNALAPNPLTASASTPATATVMPTTGKKTRFRRPRYRKTASSVTTASQIASVSSGAPGGAESFERVINVKNCPLCHRPRLNSKAEVDIITHIAVCASKDWNIVDRIVVGNFVTASQAQRKFFTKIIGKISSGEYRLGANSANIIVQDRLTGQLQEEKMQVYVRLGIRLLYKGMKSRMEGGRARRLLKSWSIKQGLKYDSPESAREIPTFIEFHKLKVEEIRDPLSSFKTFNQFFYRKLKPSARPVEQPDDPYRLVSAADCRLMTFESVTEATRLWIKGREFTVARLLGEAYKHEAERYSGGALAIFRLAPQDYHRFHSPVDGTIGNMTYIAGEYYTVNPQAIRTALDVYGENARKVVPIDSPQFGRVMAVCVGAMMVGSIETTVKEGESVQRGQEFGYFAFGGSTIVVLFEKDVVEWDADLLVNGRASLETLVRVGMGIGTGTRRPGRAGA